MRKLAVMTALILALLASTGQVHAELRLRGIMNELETRMEAIVRALSSGDFEAVESNARQIADHEKPPMEERQKIHGLLKEEANGFREIDYAVHQSAAKMAESARSQDYAGVVDNYRDVLHGCVKCHAGFRSRIVEHFYGDRAEESEREALTAEAIGIVKRFGGTLKPQLKKALQSGGPEKAIELCSTKAPEIARKLSIETGWKIKRVSLKSRNSKTAQPDEWERKILQRFNERQAKGETPKKIAYGEIIDGQFRFMKAQGVEPLCLKCHGKTLTPAVEDVLRQHYQDDKATGYSLGEVRGAFSLSRGL